MYTPPNTTFLKGRDINIKNSHMSYLILLSNRLWRHMRHSCVSCIMYQSLFSGPTLDCIQLIACLVNYDNQTSTTIRIEIFLCFILSVSYMYIINFSLFHILFPCLSPYLFLLMKLSPTFPAFVCVCACTHMLNQAYVSVSH